MSHACFYSWQKLAGLDVHTSYELPASRSKKHVNLIEKQFLALSAPSSKGTRQEKKTIPIASQRSTATEATEATQLSSGSSRKTTENKKRRNVIVESDENSENEIDDLFLIDSVTQSKKRPLHVSDSSNQLNELSPKRASVSSKQTKTMIEPKPCTNKQPATFRVLFQSNDESNRMIELVSNEAFSMSNKHNEPAVVEPKPDRDRLAVKQPRVFKFKVLSSPQEPVTVSRVSDESRTSPSKESGIKRFLFQKQKKFEYQCDSVGSKENSLVSK